ncbi:hypothetical protein [Bacillus glycinifermentans]|nr:hypothetical protein [Bacillus glycinifermentans]
MTDEIADLRCTIAELIAENELLKEENKSKEKCLMKQDKEVQN